MANITATTHDATYGVVRVTKSTSRPFTHAVIRVSEDGDVSASFHLTRFAADKAAGRPASGITRHVVPVDAAPAVPVDAAPAVAPTLVELTSIGDIDEMMRRTLNRGLMVQWINRDLLNRADCDVRKSIVFYDADRVFMMALSAEVTPAVFRDRLETLPNAIAAARRMGARYWSAGVV